MKVSSYQLFWLVCISSIIMTSYIPIQLAVEQSLQDSWISMLLGSIVMMAVTGIMLRVCMQNKDKTIVTFINDLLSTVTGKLIVNVYFLLWFMQMDTIMRGMTEFVNLVMLHNTPMIEISVCMLFLVTYAVWKGGITTISRCAEIIGPIFILLLYVQLFLNPQDMELNRILPIYSDSGMIRIMKGTFHSYNYLVDPSIILMLFFFSENKKSASRAILWGTAVSLIWGVIASLVLLFITGPQVAMQLADPVYSLSKYVSILNFIQNIDAFYIPMWIIGAFIKLSVCLFILSYGLSEWTGIRNWKYIACAVSIILFVYVIFNTHHIRSSYILKNRFVLNWFYPFVYLALPLILWLIGRIKKRLKTPILQ